MLHGNNVVAMITSVQGIATLAIPALFIDYTLKGWSVVAGARHEQKVAATSSTPATVRSSAEPRVTSGSEAERSASSKLAQAVRNEYVANRIDTKSMHVEFAAEGCINDPQFMNVSRGLATIFSY